MSAGLNRDEFIELRRDGRPETYPKSTQAAVQELHDRGYSVDVTVLNYLVKAGRVKPGRIGQRNLSWDVHHIEAVASLLEDQQAFLPQVIAARFYGFTFADSLRALKRAVEQLRLESGDPTIAEDPGLFVMQIHPSRFGRGARVSFSLCDDAREHLCPRHETRDSFPVPATATPVAGRAVGRRKTEAAEGTPGLNGGTSAATLNHHPRNGMAFSAE